MADGTVEEVAAQIKATNEEMLELNRQRLVVTRRSYLISKINLMLLLLLLLAVAVR